MLNHLPSEFSINLIQPKWKQKATTFTLGPPKTSTDQNELEIRPRGMTLLPNSGEKATSEGNKIANIVYHAGAAQPQMSSPYPLAVYSGAGIVPAPVVGPQGQKMTPVRENFT